MGKILCCESKSTSSDNNFKPSTQQSSTNISQNKQESSTNQVSSSQKLQTQQSSNQLQVQERQLIKEQIGKKITSVYSILSPPLGSGTFGEVRKAIHKETGMVRALKIINKQKQSAQQQQALLNEVEIIKKLDHPNILKMYEFYQDDRRFYIVTELLTGGELFDKICDSHFFGENLAARYMKQILSGVAYCHKMNIVHRDIKPENLILESKKEEANLKIIDFGTSRVIFKDEQLRQKTGTLFYMAPEIFTGNYNSKCDVWSCGVIMYIFLYGMPPFQGRSDKETMAKIIAGKYTFPGQSKLNNLIVKKMMKCAIHHQKQRIQQIKCYVMILKSAQQLNRHYLIYESHNNQFPLNQIILVQDKFLKIYKHSNYHYYLIIIIIIIKKATSALQQAVWQYIVTQLTTKEEKEELLKTFQALDLNSDGVLSRQELIEGYRKILGVVDVEKEVDQIMAIADTNNSEFVAYSVNRHKLLSDEKLEQVFKMFDADGSGTIEAEELKEMFSNASDQFDDSMWKQLLHEADENGDGQIQLSEFKNLMKKLILN